MPTTPWKKGLIHLHSTFSDGMNTISELKAHTRELGYDYMVVTDHLEHPHMHGRLNDYITTCHTETEPGTFIVIPGLEIATPWKLRGDVDSSTAHTLTFDITGHTDLFEHLPAAQSTTELHQALTAAGLAILPAHQFQYTPLAFSYNVTSGSDYRYDMAAIAGAPTLDFFYRGIMEIHHEAEDLALYTCLISRWIGSGGPGSPLPMPSVYTGADYHAGISLPAGRLAEFLTPHVLTHFSRIVNLSDIINIPREQLSHTTWTYVEEPLSAETIIDAIKKGRTCATRGCSHSIDTLEIHPVPGLPVTTTGAPEISMHVGFRTPTTRPHFASIYRNGVEISGFTHTYRKGLDVISFPFRDESAPPGLHAYTVALSGKLVTSPILIRKT